ncbi:signal peptidase subunit-domain-containing protein [Cladorrhinum samala]|uniref:Signal peptidase subunit 3 n=1 Tax=Cladorrhinum samala TaxID=585594 RepID=A0AAV9I5L6_9PEZI|nr:signal peptidase subunit-domain-containing protein [Cladorrhinum samala]
MYSSVVRLQNTFGFFTTVAFVVASLVSLSDFLSARTPTVDLLKTTSLQVVKGRPHYYSSKKEEYAIIKFSLDADLSSLFTWNTKQVFVYVTAEWPSLGSQNNTNQAVIWDKIITAPSSDHLANIGPIERKRLKKSAGGKPIDPSRGKLQLKNQRYKYQITHPSGRIASQEDVVLKLHYNVQPWVGILTWNQEQTWGKWQALKGAASKKFALPALKKKDEGKKNKTTRT